MDEALLRRRRLAANGLTGRGIDGGVAAVARRLVGVQAQERRAAELAWQPRSSELSRNAVRTALDEERSVVRTWAMRGTIHVLAAEDVGWLLALLGPSFVARGQRRRDQLGLDEAICRRAAAALREALQGGRAMTRAELADVLSAAGAPVEGQALYHLLYRCGLEGVICFGADRDAEHTYVLLEEWLGQGVEVEHGAGQRGAVRLARRYLQGYGPAGVSDFATWSGLGMREARSGLEAAGRELAGAGEALYTLDDGEWEQGDGPDGGAVQVRLLPARLLPAYDSYLLGYASRALTVPAAYEREIHPGGGVIRPAVLVDGVAVGTWRLAEGKVVVAPFEKLAGEAARAVAQAVGEMEAYVAQGI